MSGQIVQIQAKFSDFKNILDNIKLIKYIFTLKSSEGYWRENKIVTLMQQT